MFHFFFSDICQVRFDFESATVFEQPADGVCGGDQDEITVGQTSTTIGSFTNICGTLTGQHIYVEKNGANGALIDNLLYNVCIRREAGFCSYTVREARSAAGAVDSFQVGALLVGNVGLATCGVAGGAAGGAWIVIPNSEVTSPEYCGVVLANTNADTISSPVTGNGAQFQIRVVTIAADNDGVVGS